MCQVMNSFARVGNAEAADKLLLKMKEMSSKSEDGQLKPDTVCYTSVIDACEYITSELYFFIVTKIELTN
jgi:pentatricopeptide repeat protein